MAIKTLGSAQKISVGRESGNTTFVFLGLTCIHELFDLKHCQLQVIYHKENVNEFQWEINCFLI